MGYGYTGGGRSLVEWLFSRKCGGERVGGFLGGERERERIEFKFNIENQRRI